MLTLKPIKSHSGFSYYTDDNHFSVEEGIAHSFWHGEIASQLGLEGSVNPETLEALLQGQVDSIQLGRIEQGEVRHRPGDDLTFSAPKSLSLLAEVYQDQRLIEAHDEAVRKTLDFIEQAYIVTRVTEQHVTSTQQTRRGLYAVLRHDTSRELDPQTHSHALLLNATYLDHYRSVDPRAYYPNVKELGHLYRLNLGHALDQRGIEYEITNRSAYFLEIKGVRSELLKAFSKRSHQIKAYIQDKKLAYNPALAQRIALVTRKDKKEICRDELRSIWKKEIAAIDPNFKYDRKVTVKPEKKILSPEDIHQVIKRSVQRIQTLEMSFDQDTLMKTVTEILEAGDHGFNPNELMAEVNNFIKKRLVVSEIPSGVKNAAPYFTTPAGKQLEHDLVTRFKKSADHFSDAYLTESQIQKVLNRFENKPKPKHFISLDQNQRQAIIDALTTHSQYHFIQGNAGSGKTTMLKELRAVVKRYSGEIKAFAPSHTAVRALEDSLGIETSTLDHFLATYKSSRLNPSDNPEIWLVDEASLIGAKNLKRLMDAADEHNARVVLVGDQNQLESVSAGRGIHLALSANISTSRITEIYRQQNPELKAVAEKLNHQNYVEALYSLNEQGCIQEVDDDPKDEDDGGKNSVTKGILEYLHGQTSEEIEQQVIIVPTNEDRDYLNREVRQLLKERGRIKRDQEFFETLESKLIAETDYQYLDQYTLGETLRFNRSQKIEQGFLVNLIKPGEYFEISGIDVDKNELILTSLKDGRRIRFNPKTLGHRPQGAVFVYNKKYTPVSVGDRLRWLDNRNEHGLKRNDKLLVTKVTPRAIEVKRETGYRPIVMSHHKLNNRHFEHQHALTNYSAQGISEDHVLVAAHSWRRNTVTQRGLLVGGTRAKHSLKVFTDNLDELMNNIQDRPGNNTRALKHNELNQVLNRDLGLGL